MIRPRRWVWGGRKIGGAGPRAPASPAGTAASQRTASRARRPGQGARSGFAGPSCRNGAKGSSETGRTGRLPSRSARGVLFIRRRTLPGCASNPAVCVIGSGKELDAMSSSLGFAVRHTFDDAKNLGWIEPLAALCSASVNHWSARQANMMCRWRARPRLTSLLNSRSVSGRSIRRSRPAISTR
jgi:hypothetical protein